MTDVSIESHSQKCRLLPGAFTVEEIETDVSLCGAVCRAAIQLFRDVITGKWPVVAWPATGAETTKVAL